MPMAEWLVIRTEECSTMYLRFRISRVLGGHGHMIFLCDR